MLQWHTGGWTHRAYWGENVIAWGKDDTPERLRDGHAAGGRQVGAAGGAGRAGSASTPGTVINGWAFTQHGGTVLLGQGRHRRPGRRRTASASTRSTAWVRAQRGAGGGRACPPTSRRSSSSTRRSGPRRRRSSCATTSSSTPTPQTRGRPSRRCRRELAEAEKERQAASRSRCRRRWSSSERAGEPQPAYILKRGEYDQRGEQGRPGDAGVPAAAAAGRAARTASGWRAGWSRPDHPLTARVAVNRFWQQVFGTGLVKTAEDFGSQGEPPSHPELLDWLAVQFREDGWDVKQMMKRLVMSATYRQSSRVDAGAAGEGPGQPAAVARAAVPARRRDAPRPGAVRRAACWSSGRRAERQAAAAGRAVGGGRLHRQQHGAASSPTRGTRRSTAAACTPSGSGPSPPPQMTTFDAPSREACTVRRERTNTPLQALLLMNEPQFVEAARGLAERTLREGGATTDERADATCSGWRRPAGPTRSELAELIAAPRATCRPTTPATPTAAKKLIAVGETKPDAALDPGELAAWTMIANVVLEPRRGDEQGVNRIGRASSSRAMDHDSRTDRR